MMRLGVKGEYLSLEVYTLQVIHLAEVQSKQIVGSWYSISSTEQEEEAEGWMSPGLSSSPFLEFVGSRPQRALNSQQHHIEKRRCNTATCMTQRLADFLVRSSNTIGTVYIPTNVGSSAYGKREVFQSPNVMPL
ncbi:hypothetical protein SRHO_G00004930 [Serrasalmus rhombeus]